MATTRKRTLAKTNVLRNATIVAVLAAALGLAIRAQESGLLFGSGDLVSAGGRMSTGTVELTGSLGSPFSTVPIQNAAGARIETGLLSSRVPPGIIGDIDGDSDVDFSDFILFATAYGTNVGDPLYNRKADLDSDGAVGFDDFIAFAGAYNS